MYLTHLNYGIWLATTVLELLVCGMAYARRLYRRLPLFTAYITAVVVSEGVMWGVYRGFGFASWTAYYSAWITHATLLFVRGLAIAELCFCVLRAYSGIWALAWRILLTVFIVFMIHAAYASAHRPYWLGSFVMALDRDTELAATGVLIALLVIGRYYALGIDSLEHRIAAGLCIYSVARVMANAVMLQAVGAHFSGLAAFQAWVAQAQIWWNTAQGLAAVYALALWAVALRKPVATQRPVPELLPATAYRELSPAVNLRLRAMNSRLTELLRP
jgi:hypothetical protein